MQLPHVLLLDNYDSFTHNITQLLRESKLCTYAVAQSRECTADTAEPFDGIIFSPGAGLPSDYPVMFAMLKKFDAVKSFLGVCLGHQAIAEYYGAKLTNMPIIRHGSRIEIAISPDSDILYRGLPECITVGLYHSWCVNPVHLPDSLMITAQSNEGIIMSLKHKQHHVHGVQYHPESYMSSHGAKIIKNWLLSLNPKTL